MLIHTHYGAIAANVWGKAWGSDGVAKGTGQFLEGLLPLIKRKCWIRGWSTTSSTARPSWAAPCPSWELSTTSWRSARPCSGFAAVSTAERLSAFAIKGFYTCVREQFTEPGTAICYQQFKWNADNSMVRTSAERSHEAPTRRSFVPRPFDKSSCSWVGRGWASLPNSTLGTTWGTPPLARLRLWPSAPIGSACLRNFNSFGRAMLATGCLRPRSRRSAMTLSYFTR